MANATAAKAGAVGTVVSITGPVVDIEFAARELPAIYNAVRVERAIVEVPSSKVKRGVADVLKREGYIWDWKEVEGEPAAKLQLELKYGPNGERLIRHIRRVSSPAPPKRRTGSVRPT